MKERRHNEIEISGNNNDLLNWLSLLRQFSRHILDKRCFFLKYCTFLWSRAEINPKMAIAHPNINIFLFKLTLALWAFMLFKVLIKASYSELLILCCHNADIVFIRALSIGAFLSFLLTWLFPSWPSLLSHLCPHFLWLSGGKILLRRALRISLSAH